MNIYLGSDHDGFGMKTRIIKHLKDTRDNNIIDKGCFNSEKCDYPDYAESVCKDVLGSGNGIGIVFCSSGIGISIAANKIKGIRCALCNEVKVAEMSRKYNNANVMAIGGHVVDVITALRIVNKFLNTKFEGGQHSLRIEKIHALESK